VKRLAAKRWAMGRQVVAAVVSGGDWSRGGTVDFSAWLDARVVNRFGWLGRAEIGFRVAMRRAPGPFINPNDFPNLQIFSK
jgi:hypothetical protein